TAAVFIEFGESARILRAMRREAQNRPLLNPATAQLFSVSVSEPMLAVIVVGESASRRHLGSYGYTRDTTPFLSRKNAQQATTTETWIQLTNVISSFAQTLPSIKTSLTDSRTERDGDFAQAYSLIEYAQAAQFEVRWISNQPR